jgi:hypothetical protein
MEDFIGTSSLEVSPMELIGNTYLFMKVADRRLNLSTLERS